MLGKKSLVFRARVSDERVKNFPAVYTHDKVGELIKKNQLYKFREFYIRFYSGLILGAAAICRNL